MTNEKHGIGFVSLHSANCAAGSALTVMFQGTMIATSPLAIMFVPIGIAATLIPTSLKALSSAIAWGGRFDTSSEQYKNTPNTSRFALPSSNGLYGFKIPLPVGMATRLGRETPSLSWTPNPASSNIARNSAVNLLPSLDVLSHTTQTGFLGELAKEFTNLRCCSGVIVLSCDCCCNTIRRWLSFESATHKTPASKVRIIANKFSFRSIASSGFRNQMMNRTIAATTSTIPA